MDDPVEERPRSWFRRVVGTTVIVVGVLLASTGRISCGVGVDSGTARDLSEIGDPPVTSVPGPAASAPAPVWPGGVGGAPEIAGGLPRNHETEAATRGLAARTLAQLPAGTVDSASVLSAVYRAPDNDLFVFWGKTPDPARLLTAFRDGATYYGHTTVDVIPGPGGGQAACSPQASSNAPVAIPTCLWVTADSFGQIFPLVPSGVTAPPVPTMQELAELMRRMRPDLTATGQEATTPTAGHTA
ncbi:hypothetical protein ACG83_12245 [Frankia sp. R43]|uniref:hypothetical protein n=1 Tax=Frankia sp. R43 TaxID=269536 RepID=UPI0006CA5A15|nr:hypothetical protein [Frankia sp. R43]KPM55967.1 hypothetical protein ACG83_12245 [Frankia sp. R43]